jgi:hypothetical protein
MAKSLAHLGLIAMFAAPAASACSMIGSDPSPTYFERREYARKAVARADLILDGEVVEAGKDGGTPAKVRVHRVFKGAPGEFVLVHGDSGYCAEPFTRAGERRRLLLTLDDGRYRSWINMLDTRAIDRALKSDRRKDEWLSAR